MGLYKKFKKKLGASSKKVNSHDPETPRPPQSTEETENAQASEALQSSSLWKKAASQLQPKDQAKLGALLKTASAKRDGPTLEPTMADVDLVISRAKELEEDGSKQTAWRPVS